MHFNEDLFLFAGEKSGDLHGGHLIKALRRLYPALNFSGVGGSEMRAQGLKSVLGIEDFDVIGFTDVILSLPKLWKQFCIVRDHILTSQPKGVVLIDYPGFNLRMARTLRQKGYQGKIIQYISPTVWAWGKKRVFQMAQTLDLLLVIFPFETRCFAETTLNVAFVGNPLKEYVRHYTYDRKWKEEAGIPPTNPLVSLFPGSRSSEIMRNLKFQFEAAAMLKDDFPEIVFGVSCGHPETSSTVEGMMRRSPLKLQRDVFLVPRKYTYEMMRDSNSAIAKSGTVTLELALHRCPTVVMYKTSLANRLFVKHFVRPQVSHFCIVNILAGKEVFPELIAQGLSSRNLYCQIKKLKEDGIDRQRCMEECQDINRLLDVDDASVRAAQAIGKYL